MSRGTKEIIFRSIIMENKFDVIMMRQDPPFDLSYIPFRIAFWIILILALEKNAQDKLEVSCIPFSEEWKELFSIGILLWY